MYLLPKVPHRHNTRLEILHGSRSIDPTFGSVEYMQAQLTYSLSAPSGTRLCCSSSSSDWLALLSSVLYCLELVLTGNFGVIAQIPRQVPFTRHEFTLLVHS